MSIDNVWNELYQNAHSKGKQSQLNYLQLIADLRKIPLQSLLDEQGVYIPNDDYVLNMTNPFACNPENGFYNNDISIWSNYLIFPIKGFNGKVAGIGGFNPSLYLKAKETLDYSEAYYSYSAKRFFYKGNYLFWGPLNFKTTLEDGYLIIVDGMFDAIQLRRLGYNAVALMGSSLTEVIIATLRLYKRVIIIPDNDEAGYKLLTRLRRELRFVVAVQQSADKDFDGAVKKGFENELVYLINEAIKTPYQRDFLLKHIVKG